MITAVVVAAGLTGLMVGVGWTMTLLGSAFSSFNPRDRYILYPITESREA